MDAAHLFPLAPDGEQWTYEPPARPPPAPPPPETVTSNFGEDTARRAVSSPEVPDAGGVTLVPPAPIPRPYTPSPVPLALPPHTGLKLVPGARTGRPRTVHDYLLSAFVRVHVHAPDRWVPSSDSAPVDGLWIHGDGSRTWVEVKTSSGGPGRRWVSDLSPHERIFGELREAMGDSYLVVRYQVGADVGAVLGTRVMRPFAPPPSGLPPFASRLSSVRPHRRGEPAQAVSPKAS